MDIKPAIISSVSTKTSTQNNKIMTHTHTEYSVQNPLNREPPVKTLVASFITPEGISYDRNHGPIPHLTADTHTVRIDGTVPSPLCLSIHQLQTEFPQHEVICALECAGNRRHAMRTLLKEVQGIDWGDAAVMNCQWKGPRLRDVLLRAGVTPDLNRGLYVAFSCYQVQCQDDDWFGSSVELKRCLDEDMDVILALEMNGSPLSPNHGYPVRVVLPGVAGARWVKWLDRITVQDHESSNFYQQHDYKILPPDAVDSASAEPYWGRMPAMCDMPVNSVVGVPEHGETVHLSDSGTVEVKGYAVPHGADGPVTGVQVSADGGETWVDAEIEGSSTERKWCWVLWRARVSVERGTRKEILSRAFDRGGNVQQAHSQWNLRGVGYNGYGRASDLTVV